jgi:hypothetical protein
MRGRGRDAEVMGALDDFTPVKAALGGVVLSIANPKNLLLIVGGAAALAQFGLSAGDQAVTDDYPGDRPWAFIGGTTHKAVIDVSGAPFVDLADEARMAFARTDPQ